MTSKNNARESASVRERQSIRRAFLLFAVCTILSSASLMVTLADGGGSGGYGVGYGINDSAHHDPVRQNQDDAWDLSHDFGDRNATSANIATGNTTSSAVVPASITPSSARGDEGSHNFIARALDWLKRD